MGTAFLILTIVLPPLGLPLGFYGLMKDIKNWNRYIICLALFMAALAYSYTPIGNSDLTRYIMVFNAFGQKTFVEAITFSGSSTAGVGSGLYVSYFFFWLIGKIGDYHLAPAITTFVIYSIGYYTTCKIGLDYDIKKIRIVLYILFITLALNFNGIANNIRNIFAFSLIGLAVFRDCYLKKRNILTVLLYVTPIFIHSSGILFVLLRLLMFLPRLGKIIASVLLLFSSSIFNIMHRYLYLLNGNNILFYLLRLAITKGYSFFYDTDSEWGMIVQKSGSSQLSRICYISIAVLFFIFALIFLIKQGQKAEKKLSDKRIELMQTFSLFIAATTISCVQMMMPEYWRFVSALIVFGGVVIFMQHKTVGVYLRGISTLILVVLTPICAMLWVRGAYFISGDGKLLLMNPFISSPVIVFLKDAFHLF